MTKLKPLGNRVVIKRRQAQMSKGGILLPETAKEKPKEGEVIAVGPGKTDDEGKIEKLNVKVGDIVLAEVDGDFTIKSLAKSKQGFPRLLPANPKFSPIEINEGMQFNIVGVVTGTARKFK